MHSHRIGMRAALAAVAAFSAAECAAYITDAQAAADAVGSGYTRLEYVFVNNVVFKTGYQTQSGDSAQIDVLFAPSTKPCASMVPFFSRTSTSANLLSMWYWRPDSTTAASRGNLRFDYASSGDDNKATPTPEIADNVKYRFTLSSGTATAENLSTGTQLTLNNSAFKSGTAEGAYMWLLGGTDGKTSTQAGSGTLKYFCTNTRFYDFQVSNAGTVKCHYVPVRRKSDGAIGLLDIAVSNGEFVEPTRGDDALVFAGPATRDGSIDVRVAPLLGDGYIVPYVTRWGQTGAANLYIPTAGGGGGGTSLPSGCVPTAGAQTMRFFKWPVTEGEDAFAVDTTTEFSPKIGETPYTGDNPQRTLFGHYDWDAMPTYSSSASDTGAEEIGKLVHDVAFSLDSRMEFNEDGSGTAGYYLAPTFKNYFNYSGARYFSSETRFFPNLFSTYIKTIKSNLDAGKPVIVSVERTDAGHEIVIDGYGYGKDDGLFYIHANLGWNGTANGWYNMTDSSLTIDATDNCIYTSMSSIVFNIFPETYDDTYTIVSGRVTDGDGAPVEGATVSAKYNNTAYAATTGENGIYALVLPTDEPVRTQSNPTQIDLKARSYTIAASKDGWTSSSSTQAVARNICGDDGLPFYQQNDVYMNNVADRNFTLNKYFETPVITVDDGVKVIVEGQSKTVTLSAHDADEILACTGVIPKLFYTTDGTTPTESSSFVYDGGTVTISSACTLKVMTFTPGSSVYANSASVNMASATFAVVEADGNLIPNGDFEQSTSSTGTGGTRAGDSGYANPWWTSPNANVILAKPRAGSTWVQAVPQYGEKAAILQTSGDRTFARLAHEAFVVPAAGVYRFQFDYSARNSTKWGVYVPAVTTDFTIATSEGADVFTGSVTPESASPATYIASVELAAGTYTLAFDQEIYVDDNGAQDKANVLDNIVLQRATPASAPEISTAEGANNFFSSSAEATVSSPLYGASIYYTFSPTDEAPADPTPESTLYSGPIAVSAMTNIVKAIVTAPGYMTSPVATATIVKTSITGENLVQGATAIGGTSLPSSTSFVAHSGATYGITFTYTGTEGDEAEVIATAADGTVLTVATIEAGADEQEYSGTIDIPGEGAYTLSVHATGGGTSSVALGDLEVLIASNTANSRKFWIVENKVSHNATGSWSPATKYSNGKIYFDDSAIAYTASRAASTRYVTIRTKMNFLARNDTASTDAPPADTKAAMRISDANNSFELYTMVEGTPAWVAVAAEGITPDPSVDYSLVFRLNTRAKTYTVAVLDALGNEIPFVNGTQTRFPFACDSASAVTSVTFDCSGSVESIYGSDTPNGKGAFIELK